MFIKLTDKISGKPMKVNAAAIVLHHACDDGKGSIVAFGPDFCRAVAESDRKLDQLLIDALGEPVSEVVPPVQVPVPVPTAKKSKN